MAYRTLSKSLSIVAVAVVLLLATVAYGDKDADKRAASNSKLDIKTRMAACERLLAIEGLSKTERAWALTWRGSFNRRTKKLKEAFADFDQAEKLDPDNPRIHRFRASAYYDSKKYKEADAELTKALKIEPRNSWSWYTRGRARERQRKYDDALKDYDKALELRPRYSSAYNGRAWVHNRLENYAKAIKDCDAAIAISPYYVSPYIARAKAHEKLDKTNKAIHDQAIARTLDPNLSGPKGALERLVKKASVSGSKAKPAEFQQPKKGLSISYLMTSGTVPPKQDEMEEAIGGLVSFFKKKRVPPPKSRMFVVREITAGTGDTTTIKPTRKYPDIDRRKPPVATIDYYRTLFPTVLPMGRTGPALTVEFDKAPLKTIWPLKVGNKAAGSAKFFFIGPDPLTPPAKFLGCKKPGDKIQLGTVKWSGQVVKSEKVVVPAGVFDAFVIRVEEEAEMVMMGRAQKRASVLTWWYAPSIRWWVKRTQEAGKNIVVNQAETIE